MRRYRAMMVAGALASLAGSPVAAQLLQPGDEISIAYGPKVIHWHPSDEHVDWNNFVGAELRTHRTAFAPSKQAVFGLALFDNSFGQFSQYLYWGQLYDIWSRDSQSLYAKVTLGLIHGYKAPYDNKIPFNNYGIAPAIIPSLGYRWGRWSAEAAVLGGAGMLIAVSYTFPAR